MDPWSDAARCLNSANHNNLRRGSPGSPGYPTLCMTPTKLPPGLPARINFSYKSLFLKRGNNMENLAVSTRNFSRWRSRLFIIAGSFMSISTVVLWTRFFSDFELPLLWQAIPGIIGLASGVFGLFMLYPRGYANAPLLAKSGAGFAVLAVASLSLGAIWIFIDPVFGAETPEPVPQGLLALIAIFLIAMVLAFFSNAIAFLIPSSQRKIGYLLTVPLAMWTLMLVVSVIKGMEVGLSLDFYTNAIIAAAFFGLGFTLKTTTDS